MLSDQMYPQLRNMSWSIGRIPDPRLLVKLCRNFMKINRRCRDQNFGMERHVRLTGRLRHQLAIYRHHGAGPFNCVPWNCDSNTVHRIASVAIWISPIWYLPTVTCSQGWWTAGCRVLLSVLRYIAYTYMKVMGHVTARKRNFALFDAVYLSYCDECIHILCAWGNVHCRTHEPSVTWSAAKMKV